MIGGSNYNILGPAGGLVNILSNFSTEYGSEIIPFLAIGGGIITFIVQLLGLEKYCMLIPLAVLDGFSMSIAITILVGQLNFLFGIEGLKKSKYVVVNFMNTMTSLDKINFTEFAPFLVLFISLFFLLKKAPSKPWIVVIAIVGMCYGYITAHFIEGIKPKLLKDMFPEMMNPQLIDFTYTSSYTKFPLMAII